MTLARTAMKRTVPATEPKRRTRKCAVKACRQPFEPRSMSHKCCSAPCAIDFAMAERARKERSERTEGLRALRTRTDYANLAQKAVNKYVNLRDRDKPCVSCGKPASICGISTQAATAATWS